jgi:hypothetical protein
MLFPSNSKADNTLPRAVYQALSYEGITLLFSNERH